MSAKITDRKFIDGWFAMLSGKREPRGLFVCEDTVDGMTVWVAVDNTGGEALTEDFALKRHASRWLHGHRTRNLYGEKLN